MIGMPVAAYVDNTWTSFMKIKLLVGSPGRCQPTKALPPPNMNAKPHPQCRSPQTHVSNMHSTSTLTVSRSLQKPASSMVKPACMPNTRNAPSKTQAVLIGLMMSPPFVVLYRSGGGAGSVIGVAAASSDVG